MLIAYKLLDGACCSLSGIPFIVMVPDHRFDLPRLCEKKKKKKKNLFTKREKKKKKNTFHATIYLYRNDRVTMDIFSFTKNL